MSRILLSGLIVAALVVLAVPAFAVDGVVLINQNTINSGLPGCPGPNPGQFPISICQPGSYKLSGNLVVTAAADAIDINSDDVTLDLNGFTISCSDPGGNGCAGAGPNRFSGVLSPIGHSGLTVTNGSIRGFAHGGGVLMRPNSSGLLSDLKVTGNEFGILVSGFVVFRCSAIGNIGPGIAATQSTVTASVANRNSSGFEGGGSVFVNNVANGNVSEGLFTSNDLYGGNNFQNNGTPVQNGGGSVSQNNNSCNGVLC